MVLIDNLTGEITVTFKPSTVGVVATENTLLLSPYIWVNTTTRALLQQALTNGQSGIVDWACTSQSRAMADTYNMANATLGTLQSKYAPAACR